MLQEKLADSEIILGSKSPRRVEILKTAGVPFEQKLISVDEHYDKKFSPPVITTYLAEKKGKAYQIDLKKNQTVITADTIVAQNEKILQKPRDEKEAFNMLRQISGKKHEVYTGVALTNMEKQKSFFDVTEVYFLPLSDEVIDHYIQQYQPFDKAGAYGIQDWIGYIGVEKIIGSFYNVMGLPIHKLIQELIPDSK